MLSTLRPASHLPIHTHTLTHTHQRDRPTSTLLPCNTFHRTFQPAGSCRSKTLKDLFFFTAVHDQNRYATAHALTLALIFRASISSFMCVVFLYGERKVHKRNAVRRPKCCKEGIGLIQFLAHKTKGPAVWSCKAMNVCVCVCMYVCMYVCMNVRSRVQKFPA